MTLKRAEAHVLVELRGQRGNEQRGKAIRQSKGQDSGSREPRVMSTKSQVQGGRGGKAEAM